ncbi:putative phosphatase regulatory subunit-domain-containing protein [Boeremia exigua]|uniref:putative phosphatase regulatory subunit-domain-containing protein n=1 Tax=Boeremia exigua TaxID=749465 RepID=UPI001E8DB6DC|nr:putative phosphatase regulatory subunit-domain-containing protein [Boeremia exigua]KAH6625814.1 putative phosphatase regulatory subunit-domain-containing protein [Boeremia exigua]
MPYTPPSQRSPASSKPTSPALSRNHSYVDTQAAQSPRTSQRPALPRSVSSTSYLHKHRRSPSFPTATSHSNGTPVDGSMVESPTDLHRSRAASKTNGAITTPPDSSDDEDRGRSVGDLKDLEEALQHINVKRISSPERTGVTATPSNTPQLMTAARSLTAEARKIAHSRSSSEIMLSKHNVEPLDTCPAIITSSDDSDAEDDGLRMKPPLLRKKSGELVKPALRPASRRRPSSMPGTPTYSKAVHFNEEIEQVRHFLSVDRPIAVSAGSSPVESAYESENEYPFEDDSRPKTPEWEIKLANWPASDSYERQTAPVRVERIALASDNQTLVGNIACANVAFHKFVVTRFTLDYWKTTSEVVAEFNHDVRKKQADDGYDRFNFNIKLADQANLESKTLLLCVRYQANGQEFWDNNNSMNYQVDFAKKVKQQQQPKPRRNNSGGLGAIPRSRHSPLSSRPRSTAALDDDFGHDLENKFQFGSSGRITGDVPSSAIRLKPKSKQRAQIYPDQAGRRSQGQAFSSRYDFGASLSAALTTAQSALGDRSGLKVDTGNKGYFDRPTSLPRSHTTGPPVPGTRPQALSTDSKPDLQSAEYNELIQKFCFFGTPTGKGSPKATTPLVQNAHSDGAAEYINSAESSATNSPPSPAMPVMVDGANDNKPSRTPSPFLNRSTSPGPVTGSGPEDILASQYQYGYNMHGGIFPERSHTPQACV